MLKGACSLIMGQSFLDGCQHLEMDAEEFNGNDARVEKLL